MDVNHLEPDELEYELKLRKLRTTQRSQSISPLRSLITRESKGEIPKPTGIPPIGDLTAERHICIDKAVKLEKLINIALAEQNHDDLRWLKSRLIHFLNRVSLLTKADPGVREEISEVEIPLKEKFTKILEELSVDRGARAAVPPPRRMETVQDFNEEGGTPVTATRTVSKVQHVSLPSSIAPNTRGNISGTIYVTSPSHNAVGSAELYPAIASSGDVILPPISTRAKGATPKTSIRFSDPKISVCTNQYDFPKISKPPPNTVANRGGVGFFENMSHPLPGSIKDLDLDLIASQYPPPVYSTSAVAGVASHQSGNRPISFIPRTQEVHSGILSTVVSNSALEQRNNEPRYHKMENVRNSVLSSDAREIYSRHPPPPPGYQLSPQQQYYSSNQNRHISPPEQNFPPLPLQQQFQLPPSRQQYLPPQPPQQSSPQQNCVPRRSVNNPVNSWQIRFDGAPRGLAVDDFLFRVETLARADGVQQSCLVYSIHQLLSGRAATWYWQFCRKYPRVTWGQLCYSLRREFEDTSDFEIKKLMEGRKQKPREPFSDFRLEMEGLSLRLREPIGQGELLGLIRRNMHPALRKALILHDCSNMDEMDRLCRQLEKLWTEVGETAEDQIRTRRYNLHEVDYDPERSFANEESYTDTEFQIASLHERNNSSLVICWKCDDIGHTYKDCPSTNSRIFCYSCGAKNVVKPNCFRCVKGNRQAGQRERGQLNPPIFPFTPRKVLQKVHRATMTDQ